MVHIRTLINIWIHTYIYIHTHLSTQYLFLYVHWYSVILSLTFSMSIVHWFIVTYLGLILLTCLMSIVTLFYCQSPFICPLSLFYCHSTFIHCIHLLHVSNMHPVQMVIPLMYSRWGCGPPYTGTGPMAPHGRAFPFGVHRVVTSAGPQSQPDLRESHTQQFC